MMKKTNVTIYALALMFCVYSCTGSGKKEEAEVKVDGRGIPTAVADLLLGDSCVIDTLYAGEDNVYRLIENNEYMQRLIFDSRGLVMYNPTMEIDSLGGASYRISDLMTSVKVDFADPESVEAFKKAFPLYDDYPIVTYSDIKTRPRSIVYSLSVSVPSPDVRDRDKIESWVAGELDTIPFDGSFRNLGHRLATNFFESYRDMNEGVQQFEITSDLAYWKTSKYVTYFDTYSTYVGGAHGMYGYNFHTYIFDENAPVTKSNFLVEGSDEAVLDLIYEALADDRDFATNHNINTAAQAKRYVLEYNTDGEVPIPDPGLLRDGAVFCYQPYELGSYAEGAFQLMIPYDKLAPYMTSLAKKTIKN